MASSSSFSTTILILCFFFLCNLPCFSSLTSFPKEALPTKSGYLPVDPAKPGSAIFYTFYEAQNPSSSDTPIVFWLQGGPGCSSMIGNFFELGPYLVTPQLGLAKNPGSWNRIFGLVFLDNPIGTGFSVASTPLHIPTDQNGVAADLFSAISAFITELGPGSNTRPIYITGESYAGKYVPAIGSYIVKQNAKSESESRLKLNLKGVAIGDGLTDPVTQVQTHALNAFYSGLINDRQRDELERAQSEAVRLVQIARWKEATDARNRVLNLLQNMTGLATLYDFTKTKPYNTNLVVELLASPELKAALNANASITFEECSDAADAALHEDVMKSTKEMVEELVNGGGCRVLLYQGQHDLRDGVVSVEAWVKTMRRWGGLKEFMKAKREVWKVDGLLAGYVQKSGTGILTNAVILGAGHLVPTDQPMNAQAMIEGWILETGPFAAAAASKDQQHLPLALDRLRWQY